MRRRNQCSRHQAGARLPAHGRGRWHRDDKAGACTSPLSADHLVGMLAAGEASDVILYGTTISPSNQPIGIALDACRRMSSSLLHSIYAAEVANLVGGADSEGDVLAIRFMAHDWRAFVLLGDPTCTIS